MNQATTTMTTIWSNLSILDAKCPFSAVMDKCISPMLQYKQASEQQTNQQQFASISAFKCEYPVCLVEKDVEQYPKKYLASFSAQSIVLCFIFLDNSNIISTIEILFEFHKMSLCNKQTKKVFFEQYNVHASRHYVC